MTMTKVTPRDDWQIEEDLRTLARAKEIEKDPKRMKAAQELAGKKLKEMAVVVSAPTPSK
jgi:hypothetical protein